MYVRECTDKDSGSICDKEHQILEARKQVGRELNIEKYCYMTQNPVIMFRYHIAEYRLDVCLASKGGHTRHL
jgi:hypothetical protein